LSNQKTKIHTERFFLDTPASPHAAAKIQNIDIKLDDFQLPHTANTMVIEGAGGCLVPINETNFVIDLASLFRCEIILVSNLYLGSINHTLLTVECLKKRNLLVKGIIFNGRENSASEDIILKHSGYKKLLHIHREDSIDKETISKYAQKLIANWNE
jgi:dethiobiotin synthetase